MADIFDYAEKQLSKKAYEKLLFDSRMYSDTPQNRKIIDLIKQGKSVDEAFDLVYPQKQLTPEEEKALFDVDETDDPLGENPFEGVPDVDETDVWKENPFEGVPDEKQQEPEPTGAFQEYKKSLELPPRRLFPLLRRRRFFRR
tara:strand:- start:120 stop:548 length:429 start_codon:yes stop_codon:yes gene_type:complete